MGLIYWPDNHGQLVVTSLSAHIQGRQPDYSVSHVGLVPTFKKIWRGLSCSCTWVDQEFLARVSSKSTLPVVDTQAKGKK